MGTVPTFRVWPPQGYGARTERCGGSRHWIAAGAKLTPGDTGHGRLIEIAPKAVSTFGQGRPICSAVTSKVEQLGEIAAVFGGDGDDRHENQRSGCDRDNGRCRRCRDCLFGQERTGLLLPATVRRLGGYAICAVPSLRKRHGTPRYQARSGDDGLTDTGRADVTSHSTSHQGTRNSRRGALGGSERHWRAVLMPERIHHAVHCWMLAALSRVSGRRFGGISFLCPKIVALELLGRVLSPALPRKVFAPRVADQNAFAARSDPLRVTPACASACFN